MLAPFGVNKTMAGYAAAASDDGNAVLTVETPALPISDTAAVSAFQPTRNITWSTAARRRR